MKKVPKNSAEAVVLTTRIKAKSSQTLLEFLSGRFHYHTVEEWKGLIGEGRVTVNDRAASEGQPLRAGDEVTYTTTAWEEPKVNPDYRVVFEDDSLLVLSKPAPLPVHAIGAYFQNTLMHLLRRDRPEAADFHLAHRLDSETSGLLLLVKDEKLVKTFQKDWNKSVQKTYRAIVFGKFPASPRLVDAPIGKKPGSQVRMKLAVVPSDPPLEKGGDGGISSPAPKPSVTEFSLVEKRGNFSLVEAKLLTGRTHQVRVHLEHLGYPIVGDKIYSGDDGTFLHFHEHGWDEWLRERVLLPRLALHAYQLEFVHPVTKKKMLLEDPLPEDLAEFWEKA